MDELILEYIQLNSGPEMANVLRTSFELMTHYNVEGYINPFNELYMVSDNADASDTVTLMLATAEDILVNVLEQQGIFVSEDTPLDAINAIAQAVIDLTDSQEYRPINALLQATGNDTELFISLLEFITSTPGEIFLEEIIRVNPGTIRVLRELFRQKEMLQETDPVEQSMIAEKTAILKKLYSDQNEKNMLKPAKVSIVYQRLNEGLRYGLDFDLYTRMLWPDIAALNEYEISRDLLALSVLSHDKAENPLETVRTFIAENIGDLDLVNRINLVVMKDFMAMKTDAGVIKSI